MLKLLRVCARQYAWTSARCASTAGPGLSRRWVRNPEVRSCTVDPNLEERFVFVDGPDPEEDPTRQEAELLRLLRPPAAEPEPPRALERVPVGVATQGAGPESPVQDPTLVAAAKRRREGAGRGEHRIVGTPDADEPAGDARCPGCGAPLHCSAPSAPGYLPSEKLRALRRGGAVGGATCQRCHLLSHHQRAPRPPPSPDRYRDAVRRLRPLRALVLLVADVLDLPDSLVPDLPGLLGADKRVVVLGNKIDLLPGDAPDYLRRVRRRLARCCREAGFGEQVADVRLISAKTGFGVEPLVDALLRRRGDVYLVGGANAGKSTLFNALLDSDCCRAGAAGLVRSATVSPWPGTTLDLLRFPITSPTPDRMFRRRQRLKEAGQRAELPADERRRLQLLRRQGYVVGHVGRTFRSGGSGRDQIQFDPDRLAIGEDEEVAADGGGSRDPPSPSELRGARWLHDTPGIPKEHDVLHLLRDQEVRAVVPTSALVPRTFVLQPGAVLFVGALFRVDFLEGAGSCWFSVMASSRVPVHVTRLDKADRVYEKHAGHALLGVPGGGAERMKEFPALVPQDFLLEGAGSLEAAADIKLSSAGWVSVTAAEGHRVHLRVHGPDAVGVALRTPPLLPRIVTLKGKRIHKSWAYRPLKGAGQVLKPRP